jgi:superfamily II RNA helicase
VPQQRPFEPDPFQLEAVAAIERADCLVTAPTGAGKTWIAEQAIARMHAHGRRAWYASPLKALSNSKYAEFGETFGAAHVGILTGDRKENPDAPIIIGTTEILRNQLYDAMYAGEDLPTDLVILDEAHFLGDKDRGVVWEEVMIYLAPRIPILMLSATIGNAEQIAGWLSSIRHKPCTVVQEVKRPVDLAPLFFHPSGTLMPLLAQDRAKGKTRIYKKVKRYLDSKNPPVLSRPRELPPFGKIVRVLRKYRLLPAIFFLKSRANCDKALALCYDQKARRQERLRQRLDEILEADPHLAHHDQLWYLKRRGVGAHHAGQLPAWKAVLETLMSEGLLDAIFATSTVAAGVNFPARSVVFLNSDRFNGHTFAPLTSTEFHQMIGRAGRRGMDRIGFAVVLPGPFMDVRAVAGLLRSPPSDVLSQIKVNFSMVLNLLLSYTPEQAQDLLQQSFATYTKAKGKRERTADRYLAHDFSRHLSFLKETGYVTQEGQLTDAGKWASQLRIDQPLLIAEGLRLGLLPASDPALLAGIIASTVHDREAGDAVDERLLSRALERAFITVQRGLKPLARLMRAGGFETRSLYLRPAATMQAWAIGRPWTQVALRSKMAEGDLAMLISRTADHLRHIRTLGHVFPQIARTAGQAVEQITREPDMYE